MKTKTRRDFLKTTLALGATTTLGLPALNKLLAADAAPAPAPDAPTAPANTAAKPDLAYIRDGARAAMLDRAIDALGGMSAFVKKGQKVVIKPNMSWDRPPKLCANTHPDIIARLVTLCLAAGASEVYVFDHTIQPWENCYRNSGIFAAAKAAGARLLPANSESYYSEVKIPGAASLRKVKIHNAILATDVFINAPVLKHHGGATMTACMKNLMGIVWDRSFWHGNDLNQCITDILRAKKPTLNILDAYSPMSRNGPQGNSTADLLTNTKTLLASTDIVATDAAAAKILGHTPSRIGYIRLAANAGLGRMDLEKLNIARIKMPS